MIIHSRDISKLNLQISICGDADLTPQWNTQNGYSQFSRLFFVYEGSGYLRTENETVWMEPGYAYLIPSRTKLAYGCTRLKKVFFNFKLTVPPEKEDVFSSMERILRIQYDPSDLAVFQAYYRSHACSEAIMVHSLIYKNIHRLLSENSAAQISLRRHSELIKKAIAYIDSKACANLTVRSISDHLFVSESKLRSAFHSEIGISIGRYIDNLVMNKAKQLLQTPDLSVAQVSSMLGFCDQFYFSRQFKKNFGKTPSEYRKTIQKPEV